MKKISFVLCVLISFSVIAMAEPCPSGLIPLSYTGTCQLGAISVNISGFDMSGANPDSFAMEWFYYGNSTSGVVSFDLFGTDPDGNLIFPALYLKSDEWFNFNYFVNFLLPPGTEWEPGYWDLVGFPGCCGGGEVWMNLGGLGIWSYADDCQGCTMSWNSAMGSLLLRFHSTPEPASLALFGGALSILASIFRLRKSKHRSS